jgi:peptidyl-prolyl cis-trans isomerase D
MLDIFRRGQRWWTAGVVVFVGGVFAVFIGLGGPLQSGSDGTVVQVGPYRLGASEYDRVRAQRDREIQEALGDAYDARRMRDTVDAAATRVLIERAILALEAQSMGLTVTKQEVERELLALPGFRDPSGRFDKAGFDNWVVYEFGSEKAFLDQQRRASLAGKLMRAIRSQATVSPGEARQALQTRLEGVRIAYVALDPSRIPEDFGRDEAAVEALLATREDAARQLFEARAEQYDVPERTRARHILIRVGKDATEMESAEAEARAKAVMARLDAGEDFAALAEEASDDPGSAANGGDLGYFARGQMVPEFDKVAFELEPGTRSELVSTSFGLHIILVEDRKPAEVKTFEEVKADLAFDLLGQEEGSRIARADAERLSQAVRAGNSLEDAARAEELTLERSGVMNRRPDGFIPGLGAAQDLLAVAFTLDSGESSDRVFELADKLALVQVLERVQPSPAELDAGVEQEQRRLEQEKLGRYLQAWIDDRRNRLIEENELVVNLDVAGRG